MQQYKINWNIPIYCLMFLLPPCTFAVCSQHRSQNLIYTFVQSFLAQSPARASFSLRLKRAAFAVSSEMLPDPVCLALSLLPLLLHPGHISSFLLSILGPCAGSFHSAVPFSIRLTLTICIYNCIPPASNPSLPSICSAFPAALIF